MIEKERGERARRVAAEIARGERGRVVTAEEEVALPTAAEAPGEEPKPARARLRTIQTIPHYTKVGAQSTAYQFEIDYDPSAIRGDPKGNTSFFDRPENRLAVSRFRYRQQAPNGEWGEWSQYYYENREREAGTAGKLHSVLARTMSPPLRFEVRAGGGIEERFNVYLDREKAKRLNIEIPDFAKMATEDILAWLRELDSKGVVVRASSGAEGSERPWLRMRVSSHMDSLRARYGDKLRITLA